MNTRQTTPETPVPEGCKRIYVFMTALPWHMLTLWIEDRPGEKQQHCISSIVGLPKSTGYLPAYESLEDLRRDFPDGHYQTFDVKMVDTVVPKTFLQIKKF